MTDSATSPVEIEFLSFEGCPGHEPALRLLQDVLKAEHAQARLQMIEVESTEQAEKEQFPGSPTIRVNGFDVVDDPSLPIGLACRTYRHQDGTISPVPPREAIVRAVRMAIRDPQLADPAAGEVIVESKEQ